MKNTLTHIVNYEKTIFDKKNNLKSATGHVNFEKNLEYFKIQGRLRTKNFRKYYLCKGIFLYVFLYPERYYTSTK